jgi:release factor glutamine methyltransferase
MDKLPEFYPESDDTYLLVDALADDIGTVSALGRPIISVEIGPGNGLPSNSFLQFCRKSFVDVTHFAIDVNILAARETLNVCANEARIDAVNGDMFSFLRHGFKADVIFCNPPYVPSSPINSARDIRASYAGGDRGREFIDALIPVVIDRLVSDGIFYLLLEKRNDIPEIISQYEDQFGIDLIREKRIPGEHLYVYRFRRRNRN